MRKRPKRGAPNTERILGRPPFANQDENAHEAPPNRAAGFQPCDPSKGTANDEVRHKEAAVTRPQFGSRDYWAAVNAGQISWDEAERDSAGTNHSSDLKQREAADPVRRHSRRAGRCEGTWWQRTNRHECRRILLAAQRYELVNRQPGRRVGPLGSVAIEILQLFAALISYKTGRLEPSIDTVMQRLRRSRDAVVRGLAALRRHGFLDWLRRYEPTGEAGRGPQVRQISNAYRLYLPPAAEALLGNYFKRSPVPSDAQQAAEDRTAELLAHVGGQGQLALLSVQDERLSGVLDRIGELIKQRESAGRSEYRSSYINAAAKT